MRRLWVFAFVSILVLSSVRADEVDAINSKETSKLLSQLFKHMAYTQELYVLSGERKMGYLTLEFVEAMEITRNYRELYRALPEPYYKGLMEQKRFIERAKENEYQTAQQDLKERQSRKKLFEAFATIFGDNTVDKKKVLKPIREIWAARLKEERLVLDQVKRNLAGDRFALEQETKVAEIEGLSKKAIRRRTAPFRLKVRKNELRFDEKSKLVVVVENMLKNFQRYKE